MCHAFLLAFWHFRYKNTAVNYPSLLIPCIFLTEKTLPSVGFQNRIWREKRTQIRPLVAPGPRIVFIMTRRRRIMNKQWNLMACADCGKSYNLAQCFVARMGISHWCLDKGAIPWLLLIVSLFLSPFNYNNTDKIFMRYRFSCISYLIQCRVIPKKSQT